MLAEDCSRQAEQQHRELKNSTGCLWRRVAEDAALGRARNYGVELLREILKE